jgi:predicted nucleic acid-binding protein
VADGLIDTNVFIHAHSNDSKSEECRRFLAGLEKGDVYAYIEPLILHELSYALPRYVQQMTREDVAAYLLMILSWDGIRGEKDVLADAVERWRLTPGLSFADAYLSALAAERQCPIYTKNVRELVGQGVSVPDPLPL